VSVADEFGPESNDLKIDAEALARYLAQRLPDVSGALRVRQFAGGQSNPTYHLACGDEREGKPVREWVLRKKPPGTLLPTAHAVDREYRIFSSLAGSDVPVPRTYLYCDDASVIGTEFFVMEYVRGRIFWDATLPGLSPAERSAIYDEMNRVLAALHRVDYAARDLADYGKPGNYFARQIRRWTQQYEAAKTDHVEAMERLIEWLPAHIPGDDQTCLVHGDFRLDNMIFDAHEPRVRAVLDWELSTLGHPLADLAYNCMPYHGAFRTAVPLRDVAGDASGIPTEAQYVAAYCRGTGRASIPAFGFYLAFSFFRSASIVQGVYHRGLQGNASSAQEALNMRARTLAASETGWRIASEERA
jgi:aminoglycoside phosphotransferase (APT) family kinase protein